MALKLTRLEQDGVSILKLAGCLTFGPEEVLLNDEIRRAVDARRVRLVIDVGGVDRIDSAGLGTLLYARSEVRRAGGGLALANLHPHHPRALRVAGIESAFNTFGAERDAIESFLLETIPN